MNQLERILLIMEHSDPAYRKMLMEKDSRLNAVEKTIRQAFANLLDPDGVVSGPDYYVNGDPNTTWMKYLIFSLRHTFFPNMSNSDVKYLPVVARLAFSPDVRFGMSSDNGEQIQLLHRIVKLMQKDDNLFNEVKSNPNITFTDLYNRMKRDFDAEDEETMNAANSVVGGNSDYTIVPVPNFKTAKYYGDRSCSSSRLCYTQSEGIWNSYTRDGKCKVFVCLRNGWEDIPERATEGNPYDLYGTSMIFVFVNGFGKITTSNCRWNHKTVGQYNGDIDHAFNEATLAQTVGIPYGEMLKMAGIKVCNNINEVLIPAIEEGDEDTIREIVGDARELVIPNGVTRIGNCAFQGCESLTSITIPNSVTYIGNNVFGNCTSLRSITIPNSVTEIGKNAFTNCSSLTSITMPNNVTSIGDYAFTNCTSLTSITMPNNVTSIGHYAFTNCTSLTSITMPNNVTSIGHYAFACCFSLTSIAIPNGVTEIVDNAFYGCSSLTSINIPNSVTSIGNCAFQGCESLTSITIPNSVTYIGNNVFGNCTSLRSITIPNSVTEIGRSAFDNCTSLRSITIPNSVTEIGKNAFGACSSLTSITIPNSVTFIGAGAFLLCSSLTVYVPNEKVAQLVRFSMFEGDIQYIR